MRRRIVAALAGLVAVLVPASSLAKGFVQRPPGEAGEAFARAERAFMADDRDTAKREMERALEAAPDYAPAYALYKDILNSNPDDRRAAAERYRKLAAESPDRAAYWYALGRLSTDANERQAAFDKVVALAPDAPWGYVGQGLMGEIKNDPKKAIAGYEKAHALAPGEPSITAWLISAYWAEEAGRRADAIKLFEELVKSAPGDYWTEEAFSAATNGVSGAESVALSNRYLQMYPQGRYAVWMNLTVLEDLASKDKVAAAKRAREVMAQLSAPRYSRGRANLFEEIVLAPAAAEGQAAVDKLAVEMLASKEESPEVFLALGEFYGKEQADHALATRLFTRALAQAQALKAPARTTDRARLGLGRAYMWAGDSKQAVTYLEPVATEELVPSASAALGDAYGKLGDTAKAYDAYVRAVAAEPAPDRVKALAAAARAASHTDAEATAAVWAIRDKTAKPAADFTLTALDGPTVSLADYRGKVVLLNFWFPG